MKLDHILVLAATLSLAACTKPNTETSRAPPPPQAPTPSPPAPDPGFERSLSQVPIAPVAGVPAGTVSAVPWLVPGPEEDQQLKSSIGVFSRSARSNPSQISKRQILLDGRPIVDSLVGENDLNLEYALDYGGKVVLVFSTFNGGNCAGCENQVAAMIEMDGRASSSIAGFGMHEREDWTVRGDSVETTAPPSDRMLRVAVLSRKGVSISARNANADEGAPEELCDDLYKLATDTCSKIAVADCSRMVDTDSLQEVQSRVPDRVGFSNVEYIWAITGERDPRVNLDALLKVCREACQDAATAPARPAFGLSVCGSKPEVLSPASG